MREATMKVLIGRERSLLEAILALIGRSPIAVTRAAAQLPAGFTRTDVAVLEWIAAEARYIGRRHAHH
jgi:hypothetical protein